MIAPRDSSHRGEVSRIRPGGGRCPCRRGNASVARKTRSSGARANTPPARRRPQACGERSRRARRTIRFRPRGLASIVRRSPNGKIKRAQILLAADSGLSDEELPLLWLSAARPFTGPSAILKGNLEAALNEEPRAGADRKLTSNKKPSSSPPPVRGRPKVAPAGRWSCWLARWSS